MAKTLKASTSKPRPADSSLPEGFVPLVGKRVDGWFMLEEGNSVQGILRDVFEVKGKFGTKKVFKVEISRGSTRVIDGEQGESEAAEGMVIGLDEKGFLKKLNDVDHGTEIYVRCKGKLPPTKDWPRGAWDFDIGVVG